MAKPIKIENDQPTKPKTSYDYVILDKSGSMSIVKQATINGINGYIRQLKADAEQLGANVLVSLMTFDHEIHSLMRSTPIKEVPEFSEATYKPSGGTALADAVGEAISHFREELKGREGDDDIDVTISVFTDGQDLDSKKYSMRDITGMTQELKDQFGWTFTITGQGTQQEVQQQADSLGIANVASYSNGNVGVAFDTLRTARSTKLQSYSKLGAKSATSFFTPSTQGYNGNNSVTNDVVNIVQQANVIEDLFSIATPPGNDSNGGDSYDSGSSDSGSYDSGSSSID